MSRTHARDTRHISLARALHARLYVNCEGRIFAVTGAVSHEKLAQVLASRDRCPTVVEAPTPYDLGLSTCDGELDQNLLHSIDRALNRWRKELEAEMLRRPAQRRQTALLVCEHQEIARLASRLSRIREWHAALVNGEEPMGTPFFLDSDAEVALQRAVARFHGTHPLPPLIAWHARVVCWLSGECAIRRFLSATTRILNAYPQVSRREKVRGFQRAVAAWKQRSGQEQIRHLLAEIAQHIRRLPREVVKEGRLSARPRGRTFQEHCDLLIERCSQLLKKEQLLRWHLIPAAFAALVAADGSTVALPQECFRAAAEKEDYALVLRIIEKLAQQIGLPGYDALLGTIDKLIDSPDKLDLAQLRELLVKGTSVKDAAWACDYDLTKSFENSYLNVSAARNLSRAFLQRGCSLSHYDLSVLVSHVRNKQDLKTIHAWLTWLGSVSPRIFTPRMRNVVKVAFRRMYLPIVQQQGWFEQLTSCLAVPRRSEDPDDVSPLLNRIAAYQKLIGKSTSLPKSLRKLLDSDESRRREREHLRARRTAGTLEAAASSRLYHLENVSVASPNAAKIRRTAEEVFLLLGIDAMNAVANLLAEGKCRKHLGDLVTLLERDQLQDFARWIDKMSEPERNRLCTVIAARSQYGREYKRHLDENQEWISKAIVRGFHLTPWLDAEPQQEMVAGRTMEITVASDLHNIFLMGAYFDTCLGLGNINEMSVLTNAYDANKQVVFMFTKDDAGRKQVVARQLITISSDFKLLGYRCYMSWSHVDKAQHQEVLNAMASYSGRLAAKCGWELANHGTPEEIEDHFWYDDGERDWPAAAQAAWTENAGEKEVLEPATC